MYMHDEILEEPEVMIRTFENVRDILPIEKIKGAKGVFLTGDGTSYHASLYLENILFRAGINARAFPATEFPQYIRDVSNYLCIVFSQSGENSDVLRSIKKWKNMGGKIISVVNKIYSSLGEMSDVTIFLNAGEERAIPATKSYISMLTFSYSIHKIMNGGYPEINSLSKNLSDVIKKEYIIKEISSNVKERIFILAKGINYITALEASLKLVETAGIPSMPFYFGEVFHGPIEIFNNKSTVFIIEDNIEKEYINKIKEYSDVITLGREGDIILEYADDESFPIVGIVPFQLLSYHLALRNGRNPDRPERLNKVVRDH
ncbi:MAG: SIS domain-containing protein [Thermoplasmata archaeon]|nr:SIS domain-containing protein [Thermoplasmata archaeon]